MNDSKNSSKGLLVLRVKHQLSNNAISNLMDVISPIADELGVEPLVLDNGADARLEYGSSALLERVCAALEEIAAQGRAPVVNVAEIAPQALNARPVPPTTEYFGRQPVGAPDGASAMRPKLSPGECFTTLPGLNNRNPRR